MGQYIEAEQYVCFDAQSNCPAVWLEEMLLPINTRNLYVTKSSGLCAGNCCFSLSQPVILLYMNSGLDYLASELLF